MPAATIRSPASSQMDWPAPVFASVVGGVPMSGVSVAAGVVALDVLVELDGSGWPVLPDGVGVADDDEGSGVADVFVGSGVGSSDSDSEPDGSGEADVAVGFGQGVSLLDCDGDGEDDGWFSQSLSLPSSLCPDLLVVVYDTKLVFGS